MRTNGWMLCLVASLAFATVAQAQGPGGRGGGRGGFGGFGGGGGLLMLAGNEAVQKDLGLTEDGVAKVKTVTDEYGTAMRESMGAGGRQNFQDMTQEERTKARETMMANMKTLSDKFLPKLKAAVSADQYTRLQQINWQNQGTGALSDAEIVKALTITKEQTDKITTITDDYGAKARELFQPGGGGGGGGFEKMIELNKERDAKINEVLTKAQLDTFAKLKGKEFDVAQLRRGPGGGGPGGGGPGGGGGGGAGGRPKRPQPKAE